MVSLRNVTSIWVIRQKGPFFVAMFEPVGIVIAVVMGVTFLGDTLYLGRYPSFLVSILEWLIIQIFHQFFFYFRMTKLKFFAVWLELL